MVFRKREVERDVAEARAERIIQKKRRKQNRSARGLGAVAIARGGQRAIHQRNEDRHILREKTAVAEIAGEKIEVPLLNLSSNGVMIACEEKLAIGDELTLAIEDCAPITTAVRWVRKGRVGLEFVAETVIIAEAGVRDFIMKTIRKEHEASSFSPKLEIGSERRDIAKRHEIVWVGKLKWEDGETTARLRNISRSGAMISLSQEPGLSDGASVSLLLRNAGELAGIVRWHSGKEFGVEFREEFDVSLLVNESYAELAPAMEENALGDPVGEDPLSDFELLKVRHGNVENPHHAPDMEYKRLTLDEIWATLGTREQLSPDEAPESFEALDEPEDPASSQRSVA